MGTIIEKYNEIESRDSVALFRYISVIDFALFRAIENVISGMADELPTIVIRDSVLIVERLLESSAQTGHQALRVEGKTKNLNKKNVSITRVRREFFLFFNLLSPIKHVMYLRFVVHARCVICEHMLENHARARASLALHRHNNSVNTVQAVVRSVIRRRYHSRNNKIRCLYTRVRVQCVRGAQINDTRHKRVSAHEETYFNVG